MVTKRINRASAGGGSGEANTISSQGGGLGLTATTDKVGVDLRVRSLSATSPLTVAQASDLITIAGTFNFIAGLHQASISTNALLFGMFGGNGVTTTESDQTITMAYALTVIRITVIVTTNTKDGATVMGVRDDGATLAGTVSVGAGLTGKFDSGAVSNSIASGSLVCQSLDGSASTTGSIGLSALLIQFKQPWPSGIIKITL